MSDQDFKTQQELWKWLVDGGEVEHTQTGCVHSFKGGKITDGFKFKYPDCWKKVIPKKTIEYRFYIWGDPSKEYECPGEWHTERSAKASPKRLTPTNWTKEVEVLDE